MKKPVLLAGVSLLLASYLGAELTDPLMGKRKIEKFDLAVGSAKSGAITFLTMQDNRIVPYYTFRAIPFVKNGKLLAGNVNYRGADELMIALPKESKKLDSFYRGSLQMINTHDGKYKNEASYAYEISKHDAVVAAYPTTYHELALIIRGNAKTDMLEVHAFEGKESKIKVGFERYDRLAAGDVDGDGVDEVVFGDASKDRLVVYEIVDHKLLSKRFITNKKIGIIDREDRLACGDVDGDGKEEIIYYNGKEGKIYFMDEKGRVKYTARSIKKPGAMASGDLDGDGFAEVVWIYPKKRALLAGHFIPTYEGLKWKRVVVKGGVAAEEGDSLTTGNFRDIRLVLGEPIRGELNLTKVPIVVVNDPPKERSLFGIPDKAIGKFYAAYEHSKTTDSTSKVELKSSVSFTKYLKGSKRPATSLFLEKVKYNIEDTVSKSVKRAQMQRVVETFKEGLSADGYVDKALVFTSRHYTFSYPILAPKELAVINGKQQYLLVTVPKDAVKSIVTYRSPVHMTGYVATYPRYEDQLYNFSPDNVIARGEMEVTCGEAKIGYSKVQQNGVSTETSKERSKIKHEKGQMVIPLYSKVKKYLPVDPLVNSKRTTKKSYYTFEIESHQIFLTDVNEFTIRSLGNWQWCGDPSKLYTVGVVIYADKEDGHLVVDYYVPQRGGYYKEPKKIEIPSKPLLLDPSKSSTPQLKSPKLQLKLKL